MKRILAVSSGGGHWEQLMLIRSAFDESEVYYINTLKNLAEKHGLEAYKVVPDCNRDSILDIIKCTSSLFFAIKRLKPDLIVTTGAAPGLLSLAIGRLLGSHTIWIDSVANSEKLSLSGKIATKIAHLRLTQWSQLADGNNVLYMGNVL